MQLMWKIPTFDWYFKKSQLEKNKSLEFKWHWLSCRLACKSTFVCTVEVLGFCLKQGIGVNTIFAWNVTTERELLYEIKDKEKTMGLNPLWKSSVRSSWFLLCPVVSQHIFSILVWPYKKQDSTKNCPTNHPKKCPTNGPTNCQSTKGICNFFPNALAPAWSPRQAHRTPDVHQADTGWQIFLDTWNST